MKILYFTDTHIRGSSPKNRLDDFTESLEAKFLEVFDIARSRDVDYIFHGGDLFDRPDVSVSIVSKFAELLNEVNIPIYAICGNHDVFGYNPKTSNRSMIGLLDSVRLLSIIDEGEKVILEKNGVKIQLTGQPYVYGMDSFNQNKYIVKDRDEDVNFAIHLVHGMLLDKPFIDGVDYSLIEDIAGETLADVTLCGHYHLGYNTVELNNKYFINPGSLVRLTNSIHELKRRPKIIILDLDDKLSIEEIYLKSAKLGEKVLNKKDLTSIEVLEAQIYEFKQTISNSINFDKMDVNDILIEIASAEAVDDKVKEEALRRISKVQMSRSDYHEIY